MKLKALIFGLSILLFSSCSKEDDVQQNGEKTKNIALIYPVNTQDIDPCCINFQWQNPVAGNSRILVSKNQDFTDLILVSSVVANSFTLNNFLQPNTQYFWKVNNSSSENSSSFKIKDMLSGLKPIYSNIKIRRYDWNKTQGIWRDTTFYDSIKLTKEGNNIRFEYSKDNINRLNKVYEFRYAPNTIFYISEFNSQSSGSDVTINYLNDSIYINNKFGGMGGGTVWNIKLKK